MGEIEEEDETSPLLTTNIKDTLITSDAAKEDKANMDSKEDTDVEEKKDANDGNELLKDTKLNRPILTSPSIDLKHRILGLSQKGDWEACEVALNMLEKEINEDPKPMKYIIDEVSQHFDVF